MIYRKLFLEKTTAMGSRLIFAGEKNRMPSGILERAA
jgi:hypothetical protein